MFASETWPAGIGSAPVRLRLCNTGVHRTGEGRVARLSTSGALRHIPTRYAGRPFLSCRRPRLFRLCKRTETVFHSWLPQHSPISPPL